MKKLFLLLLLFAGLGASAQTKKNEKVVIKTSIFCDHCKQCETCGQNLNGKLLGISGVRMYELDDKKQTITVYYNGKKVTAEAIRKAISDAGYDADQLKANPLAYEKLDGCCKK